ncbi:MAG: hypothetical protein JRH20_23265, partial [Deltaproteobacteria bacterium]|nr:hypothetical protein [Deltaproteobacteria bacterium]
MMRVDRVVVLMSATCLVLAACSEDLVSHPDVTSPDSFLADHGTDSSEGDATADGALEQDGGVDGTPIADRGVEFGEDTDAATDTTTDQFVADQSSIPDSIVDGVADDSTVDLSVDSADATLDTSVDGTTDATLDTGASGYTILGSISQAGGAIEGAEVTIRLYASNDVEELLDYIDEQTVVAQEGVALAATDFSFQVSAPGTYTLRAFRDSAGPLNSAADGEPTLETDAQTPARQVEVVATNVSGVSLLLRARTNSTDFYVGMNAFTFNESPLANPPRRTPSGNITIAGGFCGGYYMKLVGFASNTTSAFLSALHAERPTGQLARLVDDGGCGPVVADNSASSYDRAADDGELGYGFAEPSAADAGDYTFFYRQTDLGQVVKLPMLREGLSPNGATTLAERRPTFSWDAVAGAAFYEVLLFESTGGWSNGSDAGSAVPTASYTPAANLPDDSCFSSIIIAADASWLDGDPEAVSVSAATHFCVDVDGQDSVTITGAVDNRSNVNARMGVFVSTDDDGEASVWIPAGQS